MVERLSSKGLVNVAVLQCMVGGMEATPDRVDGGLFTIACDITTWNHWVQYTDRPILWSPICPTACWWDEAPPLNGTKTRVDFLCGVVEHAPEIVTEVDE